MLHYTALYTHVCRQNGVQWEHYDACGDYFGGFVRGFIGGARA